MAVINRIGLAPGLDVDRSKRFDDCTRCAL